MGRPKGSKNQEKIQDALDYITNGTGIIPADVQKGLDHINGVVEPEIIVEDDPMLPEKSLFRVDEVATYFNVTERCIRLWIAHGHIKAKKIVGVVRITRESILSIPKSMISRSENN